MTSGRFRCAGALQHSMGVCDNKLVGCTAVHSVGEGSRMPHGRLQRAEPRQHSMGVCIGRPVRCSTVHSIGEVSRAAHGRLQRAEPRQHGMGVCDGGPVGCAAERALARVAEQCVDGFNAQGLVSTTWAFARGASRMRRCLGHWRGQWSDELSSSTCRVSPTQRELLRRWAWRMQFCLVCWQ